MACSVPRGTALTPSLALFSHVAASILAQCGAPLPLSVPRGTGGRVTARMSPWLIFVLMTYGIERHVVPRGTLCDG